MIVAVFVELEGVPAFASWNTHMVQIGDCETNPIFEMGSTTVQRFVLGNETSSTPKLVAAREKVLTICRYSNLCRLWLCSRCILYIKYYDRLFAPQPGVTMVGDLRHLEMRSDG